MHYLYRHIRLDKNEPFYIGVGTGLDTDPPSEKYRRAFAKTSRNSYWINIINISKYKVEILFESNEYEFISNKEIEFIKLYGRKDLKLGTLVNMTNGGEGIPGRINSFETIEKMSISAKKRVINLNQKKVLIDRLKKFQRKAGDGPLNAKKIIQYDLNNNIINKYNSLSEASKIIGISLSQISKCVNGKKNSSRGFKFKYQL